MAENKDQQEATELLGGMEHHLTYLKLSCIAQQYAPLAKQAAQKAWSHVDYLARLVEGEAHVRRDRATQSRIRLARFPVIKTLDQFRWDWPTRMNRLQVQNHFHLKFINDKSNLIFLGGVGLGKTHLATALGYAACLKGYAVLFASAIEVINTLAAAKNSGRLKQELKNTPSPLCSSSTSWAISPLTRLAPICSSKSSVCAMNKGRSLSPRTEPSRIGLRSSTMTAP